jgi:hypothetical protein
VPFNLEILAIGNTTDILLLPVIAFMFDSWDEGHDTTANEVFNDGVGVAHSRNSRRRRENPEQLRPGECNGLLMLLLLCLEDCFDAPCVSLEESPLEVVSAHGVEEDAIEPDNDEAVLRPNEL